MPSCVMRYCTNYTTKTTKSQGITYHSFPADELRRLKWVDIVRKQRNENFWQCNKSSKICSFHFKDEDMYTSGKGFILLKKTAIPIVETTPAHTTPGSPNSLNEDEVSDLELILDTPEVAALKNIVAKVRLEKQKLININSNLKKQNKRLRKTVLNLKDTLKNLENVKTETVYVYC